MSKSLPIFPWKNIQDWHEKNGRHDLPWRTYFHLWDKELAYHVWLSEIILQQTQVSRGIAYYEKILERYPTIESLASSSYEEFFEYYKWLGYYSRARNMLKTAKIVSEEFAWIFPKDRTSLEKLPGVGPYTASAILSFAYNENILSFDTNLAKVFSRYYHGTRFQKLTKDEVEAIEEDFRSSGISARIMNATLMDFASSVSLNNVSWIDWDQYILKDCEFFKTKGIKEPEKEKKRVTFPIRDARIVVTLHQDHKVYYSSREYIYSPFLLPPTEGDIRHFVQSHFREAYGLEVSVRPVHSKYYEDDKPFVACNAQVQKGDIKFRGYGKKESGNR